MQTAARFHSSTENSSRARRWVLLATVVSALSILIAFAVFAFWSGRVSLSGRHGLRLHGKSGPSVINPRPEPLSPSEIALAGSWSWSTGHAGSRLRLSNDGIFHESGGGCFGTGETQGTWALDGVRLTLSHQSRCYRDHGEVGSPFWEADARRVEEAVRQIGKV